MTHCPQEKEWLQTFLMSLKAWTRSTSKALCTISIDLNWKPTKEAMKTLYVNHKLLVVWLTPPQGRKYFQQKSVMIFSNTTSKIGQGVQEG